MSTNLWDEFSAGGDFVEFNAVGDTFAGIIRNIGVKVWDDGKKSPQLTMTPDGGGEDMVLTASWVMLVSALKREAPAVGDHLRVTLTGIGAKPKETREWKVEVTRAGSSVPPPAQVVQSDPVGGAAASTPDLSGFTPEQLADPKIRAAMGLPPLEAAEEPWDSHPAVPALRAAGKADAEIRQLLSI